MRYDQSPSNVALNKGMLMMILRRQWMPRGRGYFVTAAFTAIDARIWCDCGRLVDLVEG